MQGVTGGIICQIYSVWDDGITRVYGIIKSFIFYRLQ